MAHIYMISNFLFLLNEEYLWCNDKRATRCIRKHLFFASQNVIHMFALAIINILKKIIIIINVKFPTIYGGLYSITTWFFTTYVWQTLEQQYDSYIYIYIVYIMWID